MIEIPDREPGEGADHYLIRIQEYEITRARAEKELARQERRIRSEVERILIGRAVREALPDRPRAYVRNKRGPRYYRIDDHLWPLLIFYPLYLLISILWQDKNRKEDPEYSEIPISRITRGPGRDLMKR